MPWLLIVILTILSTMCEDDSIVSPAKFIVSVKTKVEKLSRKNNKK